jgi:nucleoside-diphosphate-sugar epimerase
MKLLVTGANGFLGNYVVMEALRRGHSVRAMVRPGTDLSRLAWSSHDRVEFATADLRSREGLVQAVGGVDCVLHLAAVKAGDAHAQFEGTVVPTENLLKAMTEAGVRRLVAISSFSVYDFMRASPRVALDEESPLEDDGRDRDAYARTKLIQERLIRAHANCNGLQLVVLRPGMIWGKDNLLNAWLGLPAGGRVWVRTGAHARVPATYVENSAEAAILAAESEAAGGQTFNVVDDALPTQKEFLRLVLSRLTPRPTVIPVSYTFLRVVAAMIDLINKRLLRGRGKVPGLLVPSRLQARAKPLLYSNQKIKDVLGWRPSYSLEQGLDRSFAQTFPSLDRATPIPSASPAISK